MLKCTDRCWKKDKAKFWLQISVDCKQIFTSTNFGFKNILSPKRFLIEEFWVIEMLVKFCLKKNVVRIDLSRTKDNRINLIRMNLTRINKSWKFSPDFFPDLTSLNLTLSNSNSTIQILIETIKTPNNTFTMDIPQTYH